jgi:hypothetical protein
VLMVPKLLPLQLHQLRSAHVLMTDLCFSTWPERRPHFLPLFAKHVNKCLGQEGEPFTHIQQATLRLGRSSA